MKAILRRTHVPTGNLSFGAQFDALRCLPQLPIESQRPGMLNHVKRNGTLPHSLNYAVLSPGIRRDGLLSYRVLSS
jgi:hypothetical protein